MDYYDYSYDILSSLEAIDGLGESKPVLNNMNYMKYSKVKITKDCIILYPYKIDNANEFYVQKIKIDNVEYFKEEGEMYREQVVSGGGSTGINIPGAIIGDMIAGPAGMVLGGSRKVEEIKTETVTHDDRIVILSYYYDKEYSDTKTTLMFDYDFYSFFLDNIPEKEYKYVIENRRNKKSKEKSEPKEVKINSKDKLKEIKQLFDEGLITEEENKEKRKNIINSI